MNVNGQAGTWRWLGAWLLCAALCFAFSAKAADSLKWNKQTDRVDAQIESWEITRLLEEITEATGWKVFVEPGTKQTVSVKFKNHTSGDALSKLFGDLSYALLPQGDGPDKLFVFRNSRESATQEILRRAKAKGKPIPNELVLTLKPGAGESPEDLAKRLGAKIANRADGLNAYRLQFEDEEAANKAREALQGNQDVESVDSNYAVSRPYEPESLGSETLPALNLKATGGPNASQFIVGLVDTKVQTTGTPYGDFLLPTKSVAGEYKPDNSSPTHGTSMLETLLRGLAQTPSLGDSTSVKVLPVDVYGGGATTSTFEVAKGILEAINGGSSVINMSLGSDGDSQLMHNVIKQAYDKGILLVAAAGNQSTAAPTYPAAYNEVLAVTAGKNGNIASYANYGNFVDVVAPGSSVVYFNGQSYLVSGTSAASAYISGFASGLSTKSGTKPQAVGTQLSSMFGRKTK